MNGTRNDKDEGGSSEGNEQASLFQLPVVQERRAWDVGDISRKFRDTLEMQRVYREDAVEQEVRWFEQATYSRTVLQYHIEQVRGRPLKDRKIIYKRWRRDLGDDTARQYALFAEHVIENGAPTWFQKGKVPHDIRKPESVELELRVSRSYTDKA